MRTLIVALAFLSFAVASAPLVAADTPSSAKREKPVATGDLAPDFTLEDQDGRKHTLSAQRGKQPAVLVFYRGYW